MPNKYSHAFVLSYYEARGFISYSQSSVFPSSGPSGYGPSLSNPEDNVTPPLTAVPVLSSDSSTASTAPSIDEPPAKPQHSASSSIVTEIYAPANPAQSPLVTPEFAADEKTVEDNIKEEILPSPPISERSFVFRSPPPSPLPPAACFTSAHDFSALVYPPLPPKRQKRHSHKHKNHRNHDIPSDAPTKTHRPVSHLPPSQSEFTLTQVREPKQYIPYKRVEPVLDTEPMASLSPSDEGVNTECPPDLNMDILPWECSFSQPSRLDIYQPSGFFADDEKEEYKHDGASSVPLRKCASQSPATSFPVRPTSLSRTHDSSHRVSNSSPRDESIHAANDWPPPTAHVDPSSSRSHQIILPDSDSESSPSPPSPTLSRASSFDSVAPPPIRMVQRDSRPGPRLDRKIEDGGSRFSVGRTWLGR
ncbi:MAG: hypothetical protein Q9219_007698 [cf. Caloplaca sp. 3 TL-2023]